MDFEKGCEECGTENELLVNTITDNKSVRLCHRCALVNNSIILEDERKKVQDKLIKKQKLPEEPKVIRLNDLWARYQEIKKARESKVQEKQEAQRSMVVLDEEKFIEDLEKKKLQEKQEIVQEIIKENPEEEKQEMVNFNVEAAKKVTLKDMLKNTFKRLKFEKKKQEKSEDEN
jgi:hypothetical protein